MSKELKATLAGSKEAVIENIKKHVNPISEKWKKVKMMFNIKEASLIKTIEQVKVSASLRKLKGA